MNYQTKSVPLELKTLDVSGEFSGYGSVYNVTDQGGDIVEPGAFEKSLKQWSGSGRAVPTLWQHITSEPIGSWLDLSEDDHGLFGKSSLWVEDAPYARIALKGMQTHTITGLSIGYAVKRNTIDKKAGVNRLHELDLFEISVVTNPMNDAARGIALKAAENVSSIREFEEFLRDVGGFSWAKSKRLASVGWADADARDEPLIAADSLELLKGFKF